MHTHMSPHTFDFLQNVSESHINQPDKTCDDQSDKTCVHVIHRKVPEHFYPKLLAVNRDDVNARWLNAKFIGKLKLKRTLGKYWIIERRCCLCDRMNKVQTQMGGGKNKQIHKSTRKPCGIGWVYGFSLSSNRISVARPIDRCFIFFFLLFTNVPPKVPRLFACFNQINMHGDLHGVYMRGMTLNNIHSIP